MNEPKSLNVEIVSCHLGKIKLTLIRQWGWGDAPIEGDMDAAESPPASAPDGTKDKKGKKGSASGWGTWLKPEEHSVSETLGLLNNLLSIRQLKTLLWVFLLFHPVSCYCAFYHCLSYFLYFMFFLIMNKTINTTIHWSWFKKRVFEQKLVTETHEGSSSSTGPGPRGHLQDSSRRIEGLGKQPQF